MTKAHFPNLFIIGAMKAGTSSLHEYLHQHPEIFMSRMKEPQYFAPHLTRWKEAWGIGNPFPEPGIDWYLRLFAEAGDVKYAGESSVSYTARPWVKDCEKRIDKFNPEARFIYLMRDPIERAVSHYWYFVKDGREDRDMLTAFERKEEYISRSNYAMQLKPYLDQFGRERVFTLTLEDLNEDPNAVFRELFSWLGVDPGVQVDTSQQFNVSSKELRQTRRYRVCLDTLMKHWRWKKIEPKLPSVVPRLLKRITYREVIKSAVDDRAAIDYLRPILQRHTDTLKDLLNRDFPEWNTLCSTQDTVKSETPVGATI